MKYQAGTVVPWWIKKYILRRKGLQTPVLYKFGENEGDDANLPPGYQTHEAEKNGKTV